jgi:hypothetical protein
MRPPEPIRDHPNATFVLGTTPLAILVGYLLSVAGVRLPQLVAAALGTWLAGALLIVASHVNRGCGAVWEYGIIGCWRRILRGRPPV